MSFTSDVKQEALHLSLKPCCEVAFLSAIFAVNGQLKLASSSVGLRIQTTQLPLARKIIALVKKRYGLELEIRISQQVKLKKKKQFTLTIQEGAMKMIHELGLMEEDVGFASKVDETLTQKDCDYGAYLRGAFVTSGSINHPQSSSYHLEIASQNASYAESLTALLNQASLNAKTLEKKTGHYITYIKESEKIADFLRLIGTHQALFTFEDERIKRDFYNSITRVLNMELANQNKTLEAADKQLKNIAIVENLLSQEELSDGIKQAMMLRKTYPEASLNELADKSGEHFPKAISKSGLNHRFRQLDVLAEKAMEGYHDQRHRR